MAEPLQKTDITLDTSSSPHTNATAPPEKASAVWTRRFITFAFWAVVATLGLPHWIWTTSIHREELPVGEMAKWAEGNVSCYFCVLLQILCLPYADLLRLGVRTSVSYSSGAGCSKQADCAVAEFGWRGARCAEARWGEGCV